MVQCGGTSEKEGWDAVHLCKFLSAQCAYQERLLSITADTGSIGKHGRHDTFLNDEFQECILAGEDSTGVSTIYFIHHGQPRILQVHSYALWALQHTCNLPTPNAEHLR